MMDVGRDAGFSREFGEAAYFGAGLPTAVAAAARRDDTRRDDGRRDDERCDDEHHDDKRRDGTHRADHEIKPPVDPAVLQPTDRAGLSGIDLSALQAMAGGLAGGMAGGSSHGGADPAAMIARQVADMAQGLAALADKLAGQPQPASSDVAEADCVAFLESQFRIRRLRARHLPGLSLGEPAWDILLDLAVAQYWRRETSVTSLCIAADVPSTTALRWINSMTKAGLIVRRSCERDGRRSFLAISPASFIAMLALAADALRTEGRVRARYQRGAAG